MKKSLFVVLVLILSLGLGLSAALAQQKGTGMPAGQGQSSPTMGAPAPMPQDEGWFCPYCGRPPAWSGGMGGGMMRHRMMTPQTGVPGGAEVQAITKDQAQSMVENYLRSTKNPNLKLGNITEQDTYYLADIVTKDGSLVDKIQVDKHTGWFRSIY